MQMVSIEKEYVSKNTTEASRMLELFVKTGFLVVWNEEWMNSFVIFSLLVSFMENEENNGNRRGPMNAGHWKFKEKNKMDDRLKNLFLTLIAPIFMR